MSAYEWTDPKTQRRFEVTVDWIPAAIHARRIERWEPTSIEVRAIGTDYHVTAEIMRRIPYGTIIIEVRQEMRRRYLQEANDQNVPLQRRQDAAAIAESFGP